MDASQIYRLAFWVCIACIGIGTVMGLIGVWVEDFWRQTWAWKFLWTNVILFAAAAVVAGVTKFLV